MLLSLSFCAEKEKIPEKGKKEKGNKNQKSSEMELELKEVLA
jgi:hypothetical protein